MQTSSLKRRAGMQPEDTGYDGRIAFARFVGMAVWRHTRKHIQHVRLLVSVRAYQSVNSSFLSQQTSINRTYQPETDQRNRLIIPAPVCNLRSDYM